MEKRAKAIIFLILASVGLAYVLSGPHGANDFPVASPESLRAGLHFPQAWTTITGVGIGEYSVGTLWSWPLDIVYALGAMGGVPLDALMVVIGIIVPYLLSYIGIKKLIGKSVRSKLVIFLSWAIFSLNTYALLLVDGGQLSVHLAYSLFPLVLYYALLAFVRTLNEKIVSGLAVAALGFADVRFVYILGVTLGLKFVSELLLSKERLLTVRRWLVGGGLIFTVFFAFHAYWILPLLAGGASVLPSSYGGAADAYNLNFTTLSHGLFLMQPHWYLNVFGKVTQVNWLFVIFPLLAFSAFILPKRTVNKVFWGGLALIAVFMSKGLNTPVAGVYDALLNYMPGFSIFRDSTKFFVLTAVAYALLSSITLQAMQRRFGRKPLYLIVIVIALQLAPVWSGKLRGVLSPSLVERAIYSQTKDVISRDMAFSRSLYIPNRAPFGYSSPTHPAIDASQLLLRRPFITGAVGKYELFNSLREYNAISGLFDVLGIKHVIYQKGVEKGLEVKPEDKKYYTDFSGQLSKTIWAKDVLSDNPTFIYETGAHPSEIFIAHKVWWVLGSDDVLSKFTENINFSTKDNLLVFTDGSPGMLSDIFLYPESNVYIPDNLDRQDVLFTLSKSMVAPASYIPHSPISSGENAGWWSRQSGEFINWRDFLQSKYTLDNTDYDYGFGKVVSEGTHKLVIPKDKLKNGVVGIRLFHSSLGGEISITQSGSQLSTIRTQVDVPEYSILKLSGVNNEDDKLFNYEKAYYKWHVVDGVSDMSDLVITSVGELNSINVLAPLSSQEYIDLQNIVEEIYSNHSVYSEKDIENYIFSPSKATLSYNKQSDTKYSVNISNVTFGEALVFSSSYNGLWELSGTKPTIGYSLVNAFPVADGKHMLELTAQRYVNIGFAMTTVLVAVVTMVYWISRKSSRK